VTDDKRSFYWSACLCRRAIWGGYAARRDGGYVVSSLVNGKLRYALAELAALPRAALVVEDRYSAILKLHRVRPAQIADGLAELQLRWPNAAIVFAETRPLAEEWTYRFLAAAAAWARTETTLLRRIAPITTAATELHDAPDAPEPSTPDPRLSPRHRHPVPDRGRLRPRSVGRARAAHHP